VFSATDIISVKEREARERTMRTAYLAGLTLILIVAAAAAITAAPNSAAPPVIAAPGVRVAAAADVLLAAASSPAAKSPAPALVGPGEGIPSITKPSSDVQMSFVHPGRIIEVRVKQGDAVKAGDLLMRLDDVAEAVEVATLKLAADDVIRIHAAEAQGAQKAEDLKKLEWAFKEGAATQWEVEHARLEVIIGELSTALSKFNQAQDKGKYEEAKTNLDRMKLLSPMAGKVEQLIAEVGQTADPQTKVIRIVNTDIVWSDVPVPLPLAVTLKNGQKASVEFPKYLGGTVEARVVHIAAVADAASDTLLVRVEIPNPTGRPAGERVRVTFPQMK
jgi:RND family efflux transporter MFP subunit